MDFVTPPRDVRLSLVAGRGHYEAVIEAVIAATTSVWIATANLKELLVEDPRARPGRRRGGKRRDYRSILTVLAEKVDAGLELRLLHAAAPSRPFRAQLRLVPELAGTMRLCPRVHLKTIVVDGRLLYLGSANWTGAGLGAKGAGRRNFELGVLTEDETLLDDVQALFDRIWRGAECRGCRLRDACPEPLDGGAETAARRA
jgi:phosphatidylserine/phosphatidylglycerophosphate/cardiolipin synthase-like enzyme